jgi:transglutaminase-like putative cysteine protease
MFLRLTHRTTFVYAGQARDSFNEVRLRPIDDATQSCRHFVLRVEPEGPVGDYLDFYGNTVFYFDVAAPHSRLVVEAESEVETTPDGARPPVPVVTLAALAASSERELHAEYLSATHLVPLGPEMIHEAAVARGDGPTDVWSEVGRLSHHVHHTFTYQPHSTGVDTRATDALQLRVGVCQDFAHVMLGLCRCVGIPARYVSGYFLNRRPRQGEAEASHAWVEALIPGYGWAAFDPTHDRPVDDSYVKVAVGRDYGDIRPVSGTYRGGRTQEFKVEVMVVPLAALPA